MTARINIRDLPPAMQAKYGKAKPSKRSKYGSHWVEVDGRKFQSKKEAERWTQLRLMAEMGLITLLRTQTPFECWVNGRKVFTYVADFTFFENITGRMVVEDCKSWVTKRLPTYRTRKRWMQAIGITIVEV